MSLNVEGLGHDINGAYKWNEIWNFFKKSLLKPKMILIQEYKLSLEERKRHIKQIEFTKGISLWNEAIYWTQKDRFKGDMDILL